MDDINKEDLKQDKKLKEQKEDVHKEFKGFFQSLKEYLPQLLNIKKGTDKETTALSFKLFFNNWKNS